MLTAECYKQRLEKGLSFLEFNYMLMQGYDFYYLHEKYGCNLEFGGDDQWSNILAGMELVRRKKGDAVYGLTFTLLTNSEGKKMGKILEWGAIAVSLGLADVIYYNRVDKQHGLITQHRELHSISCDKA